MKRAPLRRISEAQRQRNAEWKKVKRQRAEDHEYRCEARIEGVCDGYGIHGHHVIRDRKLNTYENCRWLCGACHRWVHNNIAEATERGLLQSALARRSTDAPACTDEIRAGAAPSALPSLFKPGAAHSVGLGGSPPPGPGPAVVR